MMRKWLVVLILLVGSLSAFAVEGKDESRENRELVYKVDIKDEIGTSIRRLVKRSFDRATDENADVILLHMHTYGGMVVYADSLRSLILNYPKPVWVFIDNNIGGMARRSARQLSRTPPGMPSPTSTSHICDR